MDDFWDKIVISICVIFAIVCLMTYGYGYKQGQIDAINGSVYWRLERQPDGEMLWVSCDEICANSAEDR